ncbi:MAG: hypothetical protein ACPG09_09845, partial [Paracoccaceae bacterium]
MKKGDENDPKGLISEAYNIDGITAGECRSIFLDWALGVPIEDEEAFVMLQPDTFEDGLKYLYLAIKNGIDLIILD